MNRRSPLSLLALAYVGFFSLGLPDGLLGVAWPGMRAHFGLPQGALGALLVATTAGYMSSSFAAGWLIQRLRVGGLLALSCGGTALALLGYATAPAFTIVVLWGLLAGAGAGAIDAGINAYVASQHSARTVNWLHACYGVGAAAGPALMAAVLARGLGWERGYLVVCAAQLALAAAFAATVRRWPAGTASIDSSANQASESLRETLRVTGVRWGSAAFFVYTGMEAAVGAWSYSLLAVSRGFAMEVAAFWVSGFWAGLTAGRVLAGALAGVLRPELLLRLALLGLAAGTALVWLPPVRGAELAGVALLGLACGPIFPTLIATTPGRVGPAHAANAVGVQIAAAALGQSLLPAALGLLAGALGLEVVGPSLALAAAALAWIVARVWRTAPAHSASRSSSARRTLARALWSRTR
jgi:fucose permease